VITLPTSRSFAVASPRDRAAHKDLRAIPGVRWDEKHSEWRVPIACAQFIAEFSEQHRIDMEAAALEAVERLHSRRMEGVPVPDLDTPLRNGRTLFEHQKSGVRFLTQRRRAILADDMGLGKTMQALVAANCFSVPIHVVCPASLRDNWQREAGDLGIRIQTHSWAKVPRTIPGGFVLVCDEAHYAQSGKKSQRGKAFLDLAETADAVFLLTGTPMKNGRPVNLYPLLKAVRSPLALNKGWFEKRYCDAQPGNFTAWDTSGASNLDELGRRCAPVMLRRMKNECLDLPEKTRVMRDAEQAAEAKRLYSETLNNSMNRYTERRMRGEVSDASEFLVKFGYMRQAGSIAKVQTALDIAEEITEQGGQVVIFTAFLDSARRISAAFPGSCMLIGETPQGERQGLVDRFQAGKSKVFVTTFQAGGVGITLTKAQTVILVDRPWTPGDCYQAEDRIHRIGQRSNVLSIWLQWDDTDKAVDALLESKTERIEVVMAGRKQELRAGMTMTQFAEIATRKL
jgi:SNF2 family DNA or RNA helicase